MMKTYLQALTLLLLPAVFAFAQPPVDPNNPNNDADRRPQG